ncbi:MAG: 4-hydroxy-tetrahydrodipicolinate synthase [Eubacteriales bacterium]|nr:4-hydroxy-tetrahydrodipicolinate synthase [Eubacteriales bacterium]
MVKTPIFQGSCTAIVTPFQEHGVDYERLRKNLAFQYENGTAAVVVCGTTGENATLSQEEHDELVRVCIREAAGKMKVIVGIGSNNTLSALRAAENAKAAGADGVLMVTPYYNKSTQSGLVAHFSYVADRVDVPMILYNVPSRTGIGLSAETCRVLSQHPNIVGIKEASGDIALAGKIRSACGDDLFLWSGNDDCTVPLMALGALGVISVASNVVPGAVAKLCALCLDGAFSEATALYARYAALISALFIETNPIPVKAAMKVLGMDSGLLRLPLVEIAAEHQGALLSAMRGVGLNV